MTCMKKHIDGNNLMIFLIFEKEVNNIVKRNLDNV
jgi:hypothetical protein